MNKGLEITRGKTKVLYELGGQPDMLVVAQTDNISAGDGARRHTIEGKGRLAAKTTARVFRMLNLCGIPTHYVSGGEDDDQNEMIVRRAQMIPLEVVVRGVAAGSLVRRQPEIPRGSILVPRMIEVFFKDDAAHDPQIEYDAIIARGIANPAELSAITELARMSYEILAHAWRRRDVLLVDCKFEFGRLVGGEGKGSIVLADVIDNDSWRIWPQGREDLMLDKQFYRNLENVGPDELAQVHARYEHVTELTGAFPVMRPGMIAIFSDGSDNQEFANGVVRAMQNFGLPVLRHIVSVERTPGYILQMVSQLDATYARLVYVAIGSSSALAGMLDATTPNPVVRAAPGDRVDDLAALAAKAFGLEDTVLYGRVMMVQAAVMQAEAQRNTQQAPPPGVTLA